VIRIQAVPPHTTASIEKESTDLSRILYIFPIAVLSILTACSHFPTSDGSTTAAIENASPSDTNPEDLGELDESIYENGSSPLVRATAPSPLGSVSRQDPSGTTDAAGKVEQELLDDALEFCRAAQEFWQKGELERALESLDQAYALILEVDPKDDFKLFQQREDLRFMISRRILEIYASRNIVVHGNHNAIPLVMNRHVESEIQRFVSGGEKDFFRRSLRRSGRYRPQILAELKKAGLPEELSWLPLIESGFNVKALSRARALGLWQFIPSTGYKFGLKRDHFVDERMDPEKSTRAAIAYLKELHQIFGDWTTVLAAYNCGEGRVLRVIRTQNVNYLDNFWDLYERLPRETARYVPRFLATLHVLNNPGKYGIDPSDVDPPIEFETVTVSKQIQLKSVASAVGVSETVIRELNPELRYKILPQEEYALKVPPQTSEKLLAQLDSIPLAALPQPATYRVHRVRNGETLSTIARKYRTSVKSIMRANNLRSSNYIVAGKRLRIPSRYAASASSAAPSSSRPRKSTIHVVRSGDNLWMIAKRYGSTTNEIQKLNNLRSSRLRIGQRLLIPGSGGSTGSKTYTVRSGDSPFKIAKLHNMPLQRFLHINQFSKGTKIYPGQEVIVE
jgi:membrane-bound lytic murein transglycosylase D